MMTAFGRSSMPAQERWRIDLTEARRLREAKRRDGLTWAALSERTGRDPRVVQAAFERLAAVEAALHVHIDDSTAYLTAALKGSEAPS